MAANRPSPNALLNRLSNEKVNELSHALINRPANNERNLRTRTRRGYVRYTRKANLTLDKKRRMISLFYRNILTNEQLRQSKENGLYTWIIRGGDLIHSTAAQLQADYDNKVITIYASKVKTKQETGSLHTNMEVLTREIDGNNQPITAAGEYLFQKGGIYFNLRSGTYMYQQAHAMLPRFRPKAAADYNESDIIDMFNEIARRVLYLLTSVLRIPAMYYSQAGESGGFPLLAASDIMENNTNRRLNEFYNRTNEIIQPEPVKHRSHFKNTENHGQSKTSSSTDHSFFR
jgi:hypothetical protein